MNDEQKKWWDNDGNSVIHHFIHELIHSDEILHYALIAYFTGKNKTKKNDARAAFLWNSFSVMLSSLISLVLKKTEKNCWLSWLLRIYTKFILLDALVDNLADSKIWGKNEKKWGASWLMIIFIRFILPDALIAHFIGMISQELAL